MYRYLGKFVKSFGLMLSTTNNCAGVHKRSQWQCKANCINGSGVDISKGRIPLPYKNRLCIETPVENMDEEHQEGATGQ
jgi:hypothetical protein